MHTTETTEAHLKRTLAHAMFMRHLEDRQIQERARFEAAMRAGRLAGLPECFVEQEAAA